jgi:hypothetical protein
MRIKTLTVLVLLPVCAAVSAAVAAALGGTQELSTSARQTFRAGVTVVQVDVSVLDRQRHPVGGLTAKDFTVLEDGKPREIVAFTPVELPARTGGQFANAAAWTRDVAPDVATNDVPAEGRLVVIVFDWSIRFDDSQSARKIAIETVNWRLHQSERAVDRGPVRLCLRRVPVPRVHARRNDPRGRRPARGSFAAESHDLHRHVVPRLRARDGTSARADAWPAAAAVVEDDDVCA